MYKTIQAIFLIGVLSFLVTLVGCSAKGSEQGWDPNAAVPVATEKAALKTMNYYDIYPGTVVALNQVDIRAQVTGYITDIYFKDGDHVSKGQKLYSIDAQLYSAAYDQALANLNTQQAALVRAQKDADRYHELAKNDAIAQQQVDYADAALSTALKQVDAAKAALQAAQANVRYTTITAPFDGTIGISLVKIGTAVTQGQTLLNTISTTNPMAVDFAIDQKEIYRFVELLQRAKGNDTTFSLLFNKKSVFPSHGKIALLDRAVDPQTSTLKVRLEFPDKNSMLRAGMACDVRVSNATGTPSVIIPYKAVVEQLGEYFVNTVQADTVVQKKVHLGALLGSNIIVNEGLDAGEEFIVEGVQKVHHGSKVLVNR